VPPRWALTSSSAMMDPLPPGSGPAFAGVFARVVRYLFCFPPRRSAACRRCSGWASCGDLRCHAGESTTCRAGFSGFDTGEVII
jgi:hypothetical protein